MDLSPFLMGEYKTSKGYLNAQSTLTYTNLTLS